MANGDLQSTLDGGVIDGTEGIVGAGKQQARGTTLAPPLPEQFEGDGRQRGIPVS
jgi:hypothetical protein